MSPAEFTPTPRTNAQRAALAEARAPKMTTTPKRKSEPEESLALQLTALVEDGKLPPFVREHRFMPPRRWRFDFAFIADKLAVEVEGGVWTKSRHTTGSGYTADAVKYTEAQIIGWHVLRVPSDWAKDGSAAILVRRWFDERRRNR